MTALASTTTAATLLANDTYPPRLPQLPVGENFLASALLTLSTFPSLDFDPKRSVSSPDQQDLSAYHTSQSQHPFSQQSTKPHSHLAPPSTLQKMDLRRGTSRPRLRLRRFSSSSTSITNTADSDLYILPDFEDWECESPADRLSSSSSSSMPLTRCQTSAGRSRATINWGPFVSRAVQSNMERLRRRLEGDGWDFVGGRHGEVEVPSEMELEVPENAFGTCSRIMMRTECIDEEFDVVVLSLEVVEVVEGVGA